MVVTTRDVLGFDARTGKQLWSIAHEGAPLADPVIARGLVLVPIGKGLLVLDRKSGQEGPLLHPRLRARPAARPSWGSGSTCSPTPASSIAVDLR